MTLTRRGLFALAASAAAARKLPAMVPPPAVAAPCSLQPDASDCDADYIEAEWAAGRPVRGSRFTVRRKLIVPSGAVLEGCFLAMGAGAFLECLEGPGGTTIRSCCFETLGVPSIRPGNAMLYANYELHA